MDTITVLMRKPLPEIPAEIRTRLDTPQITATAFEDKNTILSTPQLWHEAGYSRFADGSYLVSMYCPMPGLTAEMVAWWFWWHPQAAERYRVWFPGAHFGIGYPKRDSAYFQCKTQPPFAENTQFPTEKIGGMRMPLRIDFQSPAHFGFQPGLMEENQIPLIVCGHVGAFNGLIWHTEMAHIFHQTDDGLLLISRFWLGRTMNPLLRKCMINDKMALGMAEHCTVEYRNLAEILPQLYARYNKEDRK